MRPLLRRWRLDDGFKSKTRTPSSDARLGGAQQNVTMLNRMVQQLGTGRDTRELRNQCQHQLQIVDELRGKIQAQVGM